MVKNAKQCWFNSCIARHNQQKEQELTHARSMFILKAGSIFLGVIFATKWLYGY